VDAGKGEECNPMHHAWLVFKSRVDGADLGHSEDPQTGGATAKFLEYCCCCCTKQAEVVMWTGEGVLVGSWVGPLQTSAKPQ
jgi:hypothetical protein